MKDNKNGEAETHGFDWFGKVEHVVESFVKGLAGGFAERVRERLHEFAVKVQKNIVGFILVMIGFVFALVGISIFINDLVKISNGIGYASVGFVVLFLGIIIIKK